MGLKVCYWLTYFWVEVRKKITIVIILPFTADPGGKRQFQIRLDLLFNGSFKGRKGPSLGPWRNSSLTTIMQRFLSLHVFPLSCCLCVDWNGCTPQAGTDGYVLGCCTDLTSVFYSIYALTLSIPQYLSALNDLCNICRMFFFSLILFPGGEGCAACSRALGAWQTGIKRTSWVTKSHLWLLQKPTLYNALVSWESSSQTSDFFVLLLESCYATFI